MAGYVLAICFAKIRGTITEEEYHTFIRELLALPDKIEKIIENKERIQWFASKQASAKGCFFHWQRIGLCSFPGRQPEIKRDQLHPF